MPRQDGFQQVYVGWFHARQTRASASWMASVASTAPMSAAAMRAVGGTYGAMKVAKSDLCVPRPHPSPSPTGWTSLNNQTERAGGLIHWWARASKARTQVGGSGNNA